MPKLHERSDGTFYIRAFKGDTNDPDEGFYGTWQIHAAGLDRLAAANICHDQDSISLDLFYELAARRLIWNESGSNPRLPAGWGEPIATAPDAVVRRSNGVMLRVATRANTALTSTRPLPLVLRLDMTRPSFRLILSFDHLRQPHFDTTSIITVVANARSARLRVGDVRVALSGRDRNEIFGERRCVVAPSERRYVARVDAVDRFGGERSLQVGSTSGLNPQGTFFTL